MNINDIEVAKLPEWWTPTVGISFPCQIHLVNETLTFYTYIDLHTYVRKQCYDFYNTNKKGFPWT